MTEARLTVPRTIVLVGLMGAGKSCVGRRLAAALSLPFLDADKEIEEAAGCSIPELFKRYGEAAFRDGERRLTLTHGEASRRRQHKPAQDGGGEPDRHVDPEHPLPAERIEHQPAERRPGAQPDSLRGRHDAERPAAMLRPGGGHHDGDAVRREQSGADGLQHPEPNQRRQVRREAAQRRAKHEDEKAAGIE